MMTDTTEYTGPSNLGVTRWNAQIEHYYKNTTGKPSYRPKMTPDITGKYVLARDYDALAAKLAEVEAERDALKAQPKGITIDMANAPQLPPEAFDPIKDMLIEGLIAGGNEWKDRAEAAEAALASMQSDALAFVLFLDENYRHSFGDIAREKIRAFYARIQTGERE